MLGFKRTRKAMQGGLYFGSPAWAPDQWEPVDPAEIDQQHPAEEPNSTAELLDVLETARIGKTAPSLPSLRAQIMALKSESVRTIIADFMPAQPESALPHAVASIALNDALHGLNAVRRCIRNKSTAIVLDRQDRTNVKRWRRSTRKSGIRIVPILNVYPQGDPTILVWSLLARKLPVGNVPSSVGAIVVDPVACWALGHYLRTGGACRHRPVQIISADATPRMALAPIGLQIDALLDRLNVKHAGRQCIRNGMLAGRQIDPSREIVEQDTEIIAVRPFPGVEHPVPCIECGWCVDHCPTGLNPAKLYHLKKSPGVTQEGREAQYCIDCGLCSYVCPTRLPLTQRIVELRTTCLEHSKPIPETVA